METIKITRDDRGVATLTLARPEVHNALSSQMCVEMRGAAAELGGDDNIRVVILAAEGASFCAGGDLGWMREQIKATPALRRAEARKLAMMLFDLNIMPKPLIGRVQGNAFGGGIGLMSVCDTVIAAEDLRFGLTETRLGLIPATISPYVLARMGEAKARRVFYSPRVFNSSEAQVLGLVSQVVPMPDLDAAIEAQVVPYLSAAPQAVARAKALARHLGPVIDAALIDSTIDELVAAWEGPEALSGINAFFAKEKPPWQG